jgi:hypothetical protein
MSKGKSPAAGGPLGIPGDNDESWWGKNWLAFGSLVVAAIGLVASFWAIHISLATESHVEHNESAAASAAATKLVDQIDMVVKEAETTREFYQEAGNEKVNHVKWSPDLLVALNESDLDQISPTSDDFEALSRVGGNVSGQLESCVKLRNTTEDLIKKLEKGKNNLFDPVELAYVLELTWASSNVIKACNVALNDLKPLAVPDPEIDWPPISPAGKIERGPTIPPPPWLAHSSSAK